MSIGLAIPVFITYVQEGLVPRLPTAVLSTGLMLLAFLSIACGLILDTVTRGRREAKLIAYLALRAPARSGGDNLAEARIAAPYRCAHVGDKASGLKPEMLLPARTLAGQSYPMQVRSIGRAGIVL